MLAGFMSNDTTTQEADPGLESGIEAGESESDANGEDLPGATPTTDEVGGCGTGAESGGAEPGVAEPVLAESEDTGLADTTTDADSGVPEFPWEMELPFAKGDVVEGNVVKIDLETVILDLGLPVEGVMPVREVVAPPHTFAEEVVTIGERVQAMVTSLDAPDGHPRLSLTRRVEQEAWDRIVPRIEAGEPLSGVVSEVVKGGLRLDIGVDAFLPASLIDLRPVSDLSQYLGQELRCKVIEADPKRRKLVLSRKALLGEERAQRAEELYATLKEGEVRQGTVTSATDIGLFVDIGGADGLVHSSELTWGRAVHPRKFAKPGDEVEVKVLSVDREQHRISLSVKQLAENPWDKFAREHSVGEVVTGKVSKNTDFGSFVEITPGVEGLVHVSELSEGRVDTPDDVVKVGDAVQVRIIDIDLARGRLGLSVRAVENPDLVGRPQRSGGGRGGRKKEKRGKGTQSFGEDAGAGLKSQISAKSMRALDALKAQLASESGDGGAS